jgi:hypothetical protein
LSKSDATKRPVTPVDPASTYCLTVYTELAREKFDLAQTAAKFSLARYSGRGTKAECQGSAVLGRPLLG